MMSNERFKLHPISAVINFVKGLKDLIIPFLIIFVTNGFNFNIDVRQNGFWIEIIPTLIVVVIALLYLFSGIVKWWTFVYWFEENELRVKYGLFVKKKRFIPFDRIQGLNYKEGIFHRIFGLVQVMVETAGSTNGRPEAELTAITKDAAERIEKETQRAKRNLDALTDVEQLHDRDGEFLPSEPTTSRVVRKMTPKDLVILATTSNGIGVVLTGVVAVLSQFAEFIPYELIYEEIAGFIKFGFAVVALAVFVAFLFAWIFSVLITFINYYDFTIIEENERLIVSRGLLEKKRVTIPLNRVQAIKIVENPLRQIFGYATVVVESASGGFGEKEKKITLIPLIPKKKMIGPLQELFPHFDWSPILTKPPKRAKPFFYRIDFFWLVPIVGLCTYFFYPLGLLSILLTIPTILLGIWQYRTTGYSIKRNQLTIVYRIISRVTFVVEKKRIQALERRQSYFQNRRQIASIEATVMSGLAGASAKAPNLSVQDVDTVMDWFDRSKEGIEEAIEQQE